MLMLPSSGIRRTAHTREVLELPLNSGNECCVRLLINAQVACVVFIW